MTDESWPRKIGRGWNTSDGYRFFNEARAVDHQAKVDDPDHEAGTEGHGPKHVSPADAELPEDDA